MGLDWMEPESLTNAYGLLIEPGVYRHRRNREEELMFSYAVVDEADTETQARAD